jgi:SAM-dependent methyltransferase
VRDTLRLVSTAIDNSTAYNEALYEAVWAKIPFLPPNRLPWWPALKELASAAPNRLEIGPGVFPRLPVEGTHVCDLSAAALKTLERHGAIPLHGLLQDHHLADASFDLVGMFEVLEHVPDDEGLLREIARITRPGGHFVLTVPMGMKHYNSYDRFMGHVRRYEPDELRSKIERAGYALERFEIHVQSPLEPAASVYVWIMKYFPRLSLWAGLNIFLPLLSMKRLRWFDDPSQWDARMKRALDCGAVFRRL